MAEDSGKKSELKKTWFKKWWVWAAVLVLMVAGISGISSLVGGEKSITDVDVENVAESQVPVVSSGIEKSLDNVEDTLETAASIAEAPVPSTALMATPTPAATATPTPTPAATVSGNLIVHFIDLGQGDSILIQFPNGENMLIDGGESNYASSIRRYMTAQGVTKIDYLVATHPHSDHIGGLPNIIDNTDIGAVYMPKVLHTTKTFEDLLDSIENKGLEINTAKAGVNILRFGDLVIDIVAPVSDSYKALNDYSAVVRLKYGSTAFLFTGDAESVSEGQITANIASDVLKVGHHGSDSSTTSGFLSKVAPAYAVISCGAGNSYGHPTDNTLARLDNASIDVYRTDLQGTIVFTSDGESITVNTAPTVYQPQSTPTPAPTPAPVPAETPPPAPVPEPEPPASDSTLVWLSATGSKYHAINNCGTMNPDKARQVSLEEAKQGYEPCKNCKPPG